MSLNYCTVCNDMIIIATCVQCRNSILDTDIFPMVESVSCGLETESFYTSSFFKPGPRVPGFLKLFRP